eukprot:COSAG02_NODE_4024_length_5890_cov_2.925574_5_plen_94_part_00
MPCCEQGEGLHSVAEDPTTVPEDTPSPCPLVILLPDKRGNIVCEREELAAAWWQTCFYTPAYRTMTRHLSLRSTELRLFRTNGSSKSPLGAQK